MTEDQLLERAQGMLQARRWNGSGSAEPVFSAAAVLVTPILPRDELSEFHLPLCWLAPGDADPDDEHDDLFLFRFTANVVQSVAGDRYGQRTYLGSNAPSVDGSDGQGIAAVCRQVHQTLRGLTAGKGMRIASRGASMPLPQLDTDSDYVILREMSYEAWIGVDVQHEQPRFATATGSAPVTVAWDAPNDLTEFDTYVVRRASGVVPVALPTEGTSVPYTSGTSVDDTPGSGTWTYCVFAMYDRGFFSNFTYVTVVVP